ncbi:hypothetical protein [Mucilaginibacter sp. UR6-11]|uniref:hypothetical protein n=1 Tax=Mucilaginibacter sp. UR6-11 TaxID=1435644 RepID=UPI001E530DA3|nr:hypothetical protein [Mucilaginibacter sp. UR6-11]MCC8424947.1 hypothetical protein [Mucilaginibacter sp. UR6-11]
MQAIFSRNPDIDKIAFLDWRMSSHNDILNILNLAEGFMLSSIRLARLCLINNSDKKADILIFPILTNVNHGIELYLKAITWMLNKYMKLDLRIEGSHNIKQIYKTVKSKIKIYGGQMSIKEFDSSMENLEAYINELFYKINATDKKDNMDFSRYPFNTKYEHHFYVGLIGDAEIDLENFVSRFEDIYKSLENLSDFIYWHELEDDE